MTEAGTGTALSETDEIETTAASPREESGDRPPEEAEAAAEPEIETGIESEVQPGIESEIESETAAAHGPSAGPDEPDDESDGEPDESDGEPDDETENETGFRPFDLVFYPQIGHCDVGGVIADRRTGLDLLELTPRETGGSNSVNRILVPVEQLDARGIRRSGASPGVIEEILGSDFEPTIEDAAERLDLITAQEKEGTVGSLAHALKRLHLRRETNAITREEEKRRVRIRKWLVAEYMAEEEGRTSGQAQSAITRFLARTMKAVREREKEAAREARKRERAERKAEVAAKQARRRGQA